jgi:di/tricarboxylate transporter
VSDSAISFVVLAVAVVLFVWNRVPTEIVALGAAIALYAAGVLDANQVFAGFGDPVVPFLAGLFVISEGLDASGVTGWAGQQLIARAGSRSRLVVALLAFVAVLSALITVKRRRRGAVTDGCSGGAADRNSTVAATDAARVRGERGFAAGADRHARESACFRGFCCRWARRVWLLCLPWPVSRW